MRIVHLGAVRPGFLGRRKGGGGAEEGRRKGGIISIALVLIE